jgi:hypothetical protein
VNGARVLFVGYLLVIVVGLGCAIVIGVLHR